MLTAQAFRLRLRGRERPVDRPQQNERHNEDRGQRVFGLEAEAADFDVRGKVRCLDVRHGYPLWAAASRNRNVVSDNLKLIGARSKRPRKVQAGRLCCVQIELTVLPAGLAVQVM